MLVECPACSNQQSLRNPEACGQCRTSFSGHLYRKYKKPLLSATTALFIGAYGSYKISDVFFDHERYPLRIEYEIVNACVNSSERIVSSSVYLKKHDVCLCAQQATSRTISYGEMEADPHAFTAAFKRNAAGCR